MCVSTFGLEPPRDSPSRFLVLDTPSFSSPFASLLLPPRTKPPLSPSRCHVSLLSLSLSSPRGGGVRRELSPLGLLGPSRPRRLWPWRSPSPAAAEGRASAATRRRWWGRTGRWTGRRWRGSRRGRGSWGVASPTPSSPSSGPRAAVRTLPHPPPPPPPPTITSSPPLLVESRVIC